MNLLKKAIDTVGVIVIVLAVIVGIKEVFFSDNELIGFIIICLAAIMVDVSYIARNTKEIK